MKSAYNVSVRLNDSELDMLEKLMIELQADNISNILRLTIQCEYERCKKEGLL